MKTLHDTYQPERWLVLSQTVYDSIRAEASGGDDLFSLRLDTGLVQPCDPAQLSSQLPPLARDGCRTVHLVVEQLDAETMLGLQGLRDRIPADCEIQLHDWYESPSDILMSLNAPDQRLCDRLRQASGQGSAPPLTPAPMRGGEYFWRRYRRALADWERAARQEYGDYFGQCYSARPIDWAAVIAPTSSPGADVVDAAGALLAGAIRWLVPAAPGGVRTGGVEAKTDGDAPLEWTFADGEVTVTVRAGFTGGASGGPRCCELLTFWAGPQHPPQRLTLNFVDEGFSIPVSGARWVTEFGPQRRQCTSVSIDDPAGALQALLGRFSARGSQPSLDVADAEPREG